MSALAADNAEEKDREALRLIGPERGYGGGVHPPAEMVLTYRLDRERSWSRGGDGTVTDREWALSLFNKRHHSSVCTQLPSSKDHANIVPKDLREGLSNFGLFVFPSGIKIGEIERKMQSIMNNDDNNCMDKEAALEALMSKLTTPKQHSFAATLGDGSRIYGHVIQMMIPFATDEIGRVRDVINSRGEDRDGAPCPDEDFVVPLEVYEPIAFCLLTRLPFHKTFHQAIQNYFVAGSFDLSSHLSVRDVARGLFTAFNTNTPVPSSLAPPDPESEPGLCKVLERVYPAHPHVDSRQYLDAKTCYPIKNHSEMDSKSNEKPAGPMLPLSDIDYSVLFQSLCPRNVLRVLRSVMMDQCIIFFSDDVGKLLPAIECLADICYPFDIHSNVYMPVVPIQIAQSNDGVLFTMPFQYVMGMSKHTLAYVDTFIPSNVTRVDLCSNTVWQGNEASYPHLPTCLMLKLFTAYHRYGGFGLPDLSKGSLFSSQKDSEFNNPDYGLSIGPPDLPEGIDPAVKVLALKTYSKIISERMTYPQINAKSNIASDSESVPVLKPASPEQSSQMTRLVDKMCSGLFEGGKTGMFKAVYETMDIMKVSILNESGAYSQPISPSSLGRDRQTSSLKRMMMMRSGVGMGKATGPGTRAFNALKVFDNIGSSSGGAAAAITGGAVGITSGAAGGDNFEELWEDTLPWKDISRQLFLKEFKHESIDMKGDANSTSIHRSKNESSSTFCHPHLLRIKTLSFMLSLFKSYGLYMRKPAGNVLASSGETSETSSTKSTAAARDPTLSVSERIEILKSKKKSFDCAGFLADCLPEDSPFLERFVGCTHENSTDLRDLRSNQENGTQIWSQFIQGRETQTKFNLDAFAKCSFSLMQERVKRLKLSLLISRRGKLWCLPRRRQKMMNKFALEAEKNMNSRLAKKYRTVSYEVNRMKNSADTMNADKDDLQTKMSTYSAAELFELCMRHGEARCKVGTFSSDEATSFEEIMSYVRKKDKQFEKKKATSDLVSLPNGFKASLSDVEKRRNIEFQEKAWVFSEFHLDNLTLKCSKQFSVEIVPQVDGSTGTILRVPSSDAQAGRLFKTEFAFEIVQPNGVIHTVCATSAVSRREWLEAIDARRRGGQLNDLEAAYLPDSSDSTDNADCLETHAKGARQRRAQKTAEWALQNLSDEARLPMCSNCIKCGAVNPKGHNTALRKKSLFGRFFGS